MKIFSFLICLCCFVSCVQPTRKWSAADIASYTNKLELLYEPYGKAPDFTWRALHPEEKFESLETYINRKPSALSNKRRKIYIAPMGDFSDAQSKIMYETSQYVEAFFGVEVVLMQTRVMPEVPSNMKRNLTEHIQYNATYFIDHYLSLDTLAEAAMLIALTNYDLYPKDSWNYVFGMASLQERVGIWSINRFGDPSCDSLAFQTCLERTRKVATHEIGHMFSIKHCIRYPCVMNGSNSMPETDVHPVVLCPDCLSKLSWNIDQSPLSHPQRLAAYWQQHHNQKISEVYEQQLSELE